MVDVVCEKTNTGVMMTESRCSCGYLHAKGYPCRHVLRVAPHLYVTVRTEGLVLAGWHVQDAHITASAAGEAPTTIWANVGQTFKGHERGMQDDAMVVEGVDTTMREMSLDLRAMVEKMGGARGLLDPRAVATVQ